MSEVEKSHKTPIKNSRRSKTDITSFIVKASSEVGAKTSRLFELSEFLDVNQ